MRLDKLLGSIEELLPKKTAVDGDRIGLQIQGSRDKITNILVSLELNDKVIEEAVKLKTDCIITFHPLIYYPLYSITETNRTGRLTTKLIKNSLTLITIHTNFDSYFEGTSKIFADKLGLKSEGFLEPSDGYTDRGMGVIAKPDKPLNPADLIKKVQEITNAPLRYSEGQPGKKIEKIAIVGGSGTSFLSSALNQNADAMITADVSYHQFHSVDGVMMLIDPGHYEMEQFVPEAMANLLRNRLDNKEIEKVIQSEVHTNPVRFFPEENYTLMQKNYLLNKLV